MPLQGLTKIPCTCGSTVPVLTPPLSHISPLPLFPYERRDFFFFFNVS